VNTIEATRTLRGPIANSLATDQLNLMADSLIKC